MNEFRMGALLIAVSAMLAGCSSTPVTVPTDESAAAATSTAAPEGVTPPASAKSKSVAPASVAAVTLLPHLDPSNPISTERSVYFDFDESSIKREYNRMVERHGHYLAGKPGLSIKIEGHTDERGGTEYNLALGQRRAEAVLSALKFLGVADEQMEAVSWGEERSKAPGHDEAAWAQNRRADLVYPTK